MRTTGRKTGLSRRERGTATAMIAKVEEMGLHYHPQYYYLGLFPNLLHRDRFTWTLTCLVTHRPLTAHDRMVAATATGCMSPLGWRVTTPPLPSWR